MSLIFLQPLYFGHCAVRLTPIIVDYGRTAYDPSNPPSWLPRIRTHPALAVPAGAVDRQVLPAVHLLDWGWLGVQTNRS